MSSSGQSRRRQSRRPLAGGEPTPELLRAIMAANRLEGAYVLSRELKVIADASGAVSALAANRAAADYRTLFAELVALGGLLGFTAEEIERAYLQKNEKNHQRQNEGY